MGVRFSLVVSMLVFLLVGEVVSMRRHSHSPPKVGQKSGNPPRSKSYSPPQASRGGTRRSSDSFRQREGKQPINPWEDLQTDSSPPGKESMGWGEIEMVPSTPPPQAPTRMVDRRPPPPPPQVTQSFTPVVVPPQPKIWNDMTSVEIGSRMGMVKSMRDNDDCIQEGNTGHANERCAKMVDFLNSVPPEYRTEACPKITHGKCRATNRKDARGKKVYECTCYTYTRKTSFRCLSRKMVNTSETLRLADCVA